MEHAASPDPAPAVALAWQPRPSRPALAALFALDRRLARVVAQAREPMLAQVRLAWWRERLGEPSGARPVGEPLLAELGQTWAGAAGTLVPLVDGWEHLLGEASLPKSALEGFAEGRGGAFAAFAALAGAADGAAAAAAGRVWAFAELASQSSHKDERARALALGRREEARPISARALRGLAVLGGLSRRALARGEPLMSGRGAALAAMRLGMFGG